MLGTSETLDGALEWLRAKRDTAFFLFVHNWATHMPYDIVHADRKNWLAAKQEVISGIQSDSAGALESMREGYRTAVERQSEVLVASFLEELESLGRREDTVFAFLSDHGESWGERFADEGRRAGRLPHARRDPLRRDRRGAADPLGARAARPGVVSQQVRSVDLMPTLLELAGLPARETDGESLLHVDGDRAAIVAGTDMGALTKLAVRKPPWKLILDVESGEEEAYRLDLDPRELAAARGCAAGAARASCSASSRAPRRTS